MEFLLACKGVQSMHKILRYFFRPGGEGGGGVIVLQKRHLSNHLDFVNFGALIPNIDVMRAISRNLSIVLVIEVLYATVVAAMTEESTRCSIVYKSRAKRCELS